MDSVDSDIDLVARLAVSAGDVQDMDGVYANVTPFHVAAIVGYVILLTVKFLFTLNLTELVL